MTGSNIMLSHCGVSMEAALLGRYLKVVPVFEAAQTCVGKLPKRGDLPNLRLFKKNTLFISLCVISSSSVLLGPLQPRLPDVPRLHCGLRSPCQPQRRHGSHGEQHRPRSRRKPLRHQRLSTTIRTREH